MITGSHIKFDDSDVLQVLKLILVKVKFCIIEKSESIFSLYNDIFVFYIDPLKISLIDIFKGDANFYRIMVTCTFTLYFDTQYFSLLAKQSGSKHWFQQHGSGTFKALNQFSFQYSQLIWWSASRRHHRWSNWWDWFIQHSCKVRIADPQPCSKFRRGGDSCTCCKAKPSCAKCRRKYKGTQKEEVCKRGLAWKETSAHTACLKQGGAHDNNITIVDTHSIVSSSSSSSSSGLFYSFFYISWSKWSNAQFNLTLMSYYSKENNWNAIISYVSAGLNMSVGMWIWNLCELFDSFFLAANWTFTITDDHQLIGKMNELKIVWIKREEIEENKVIVNVFSSFFAIHIFHFLFFLFQKTAVCFSVLLSQFK